LRLESPTPLGTIILNGNVVQTPGWMKSLDISGLVRADGENVLRWAPDLPDFKREYTKPVPALQLTWLP
jgi:hypothetical protein